MRRFLFFVLLQLCATLAGATTLTFTAPATTGTNQEFAVAHIRLDNPTGAATTRYLQSNGNPKYVGAASAANPSIQLLSTDSTFNIPANGFLDIPVRIKLYKNNATTGNFSGGDPNYYSFQIRTDAYVYTHAVITLEATVAATAGGSFGLTETNIRLSTIQISNAAPSAKVTVTADANAAGTRSYTWTPSGGTASASVSTVLVQGSNLVYNTTTPATIANGSVFKVLQASGSTMATIGQGTVAKDGSGNFDLTINAVGLPVSGVVVIMGQLGLSGPARLSTGGFSGYSTFTLDGMAGQQFTQSWEPASQVTAGAYLKVEWNPQVEGRDWMQVALGNVTKAPDGSFAISLTISGDGDPPEPDPTDAVFKLDAVSYDPGAKIVQLEIDGVLYSPTPAAIGGDPENGTRSVHTVTIPGGGLNMGGKSYKWVVSGSLDGVAVQRKTVAFGVAPSGPMLQQGEFLVGQGFEAVATVTLGQPTYVSPDLPPANPYDPNAPPDPAATPEQAAAAEAKKDDYESTNKAVSDALKEALDAGPGSSSGPGPGSGEADGIVDKGKIAAGKFADAVTGTKNKVGGFTAGTLNGQSSSLALTFPLYGAATLNLAPYDPWPGLARSILLGWFAWLTAVSGARILRSAFAG